MSAAVTPTPAHRPAAPGHQLQRHSGETPAPRPEAAVRLAPPALRPRGSPGPRIPPRVGVGAAEPPPAFPDRTDVLGRGTPGGGQATPGIEGTAQRRQPLTPGGPRPRCAQARPLGAAREEAPTPPPAPRPRSAATTMASGPSRPPQVRPRSPRQAGGQRRRRGAGQSRRARGQRSAGPGLAAVSQRRRDKAGPRRLGASILAPRPPAPRPEPRPRAHLVWFCGRDWAGRWR